MSQVPGQDPAFMEAINKHMRVPERLSVGTGQQWRREGEEEEESSRRVERFPSAVTMQVPDRLTYTEAPDMSPSPLFSPTKLNLCGPLSLDPSWESSQGEAFIREALQSPIRRSFSDQSFGRTPPGTPMPHRHILSLPRQPSNLLIDSWNSEEDGGAAVEFIILRRQVIKMSRRLAALERHSAERRNAELVLFSLLLSACVLNVWLWIRR